MKKNLKQADENPMENIQELAAKYDITDKDLDIMLNCLANQETTAIVVIFSIHQVSEEDGQKFALLLDKLVQEQRSMPGSQPQYLH